MCDASSSDNLFHGFKNLREIGRGGFGVVYSAERVNGEKVALKKIDSSVPGIRVYNEIRSLKSLKHRNIVEIYEDFVDNHSTYLVMELCTLGSIRSYVRDKGRLPDNIAGHVMRQLISAVNFMHNRNVLHRDLSSGNVLIKSIRRGFLNVKIADFGLATSLKRGETACTVVGTPGFIAPQVFNQEYDQSADVFSLGGVLYTMLTANDPPRFGSPSLNGLSRTAANLIEGMMHPNAANRILLHVVSASDFMRDSESNENFSRELSSERGPMSRDRGWDSALGCTRSTADVRRSSERRNDDHRVPLRATSQPPRSRSRRPSLHNEQPTNHARLPSITRVPDSSSWPINLERLSGQKMKTPGGRYIVESEAKARLEATSASGPVKHILVVEISAGRKSQQVSIYRPREPRVMPANEQDPLVETQRAPTASFYSQAEMPKEVLADYNRLVRMVSMNIRGRVPKLTFNRPEQFPQASAQLMENGDLRIKSAVSVIVKKAGINDVYNYPNGAASNKQLVTGAMLSRVEQVFDYLRKMESCMVGMGNLKVFPLVFSVSDNQTSPMSSSRVSRMPFSAVNSQQQSIKPMSAPSAYLRQNSDYGKENVPRVSYKFKLDKNNKCIAICWNDGRQLRQSTRSADDFIFSDGKTEQRFNRKKDVVPTPAFELMRELLPKLAKA